MDGGAITVRVSVVQEMRMTATINAVPAASASLRIRIGKAA
jgi:hypothetical protein